MALACAAAALSLFASPLTAQEAVPPAPPPDSTPAVPPAPPPDRQVTPGGPPPFLPMPKRPPQHRWVDMGGHHRTSTTRHRTVSRAHHKKTKAARHRLTRTEKDIRYCDSLSHRKAMHNHVCAKLMKQRAKAKAHHRLTRAGKNSR